MLLSLHGAHCIKVSRDGLRELANLRTRGANPTWCNCGECRRDWIDKGWRCPGSLHFHGTPSAGLVNPGADEAVLAAELGLDVATYRLLKMLEERDILPEDYDLLGRLDETVKPKTLSKEDLNRFETKTYVAPSMASTISLPEFGMDFWRLPSPVLACEKADESNHCCAVDFWRLPVAMLKDDDNTSTTTTDDDGSSYLHSADVCGVCLVDFDDADEMRVLPCGHCFHRECIDHWLLNSSTVCPVDKRDLQHAD